MQAVILAAGMGRRLGELTRENTKCMVKVHGKYLIERMLDTLLDNEISRVVIVIGFEGQKVVNFVGETWNGMPVHYVWNHDYATTNNIYSLHLAEKFLIEDDTILLESDLILEPSIVKSLIACPHSNVAVVSKYESWMDGTVVQLDDDDNILRFIPKKHFRFDELAEYYKTVNVYKFSKNFLVDSYLPFLKAYSSAMGKNEYYEQVLRIVIALERQDLKALRLHEEKWYEIDDPQDLRNAETVFCESEKRLESFATRWGGYWRFPKLKDYCFLVNPYFPTPLLKAELRSRLDTLLTEYPSGQQELRRLAAQVFNCHFDQILVGNGAAELINVLITGEKGKVGIVTPTFHEYANRIGFENCSQLVPLMNNQDFAYSIEDLKKLANQSDVLVLINPDNPSGHCLAKNELLQLLDWMAKCNKRLILDESFVDFSNEGLEATFLDEELLNRYTNLVVLKSISKSYGIPGIRLGVLASGDSLVIDRVSKGISIWNINSFGEFFLQIFDKFEKDYQMSLDKIKAERDRFYKCLQTIPYLRVIPSQANYFLAEVKEPWTSESLCRKMLDDYEILLKDCKNKPGFLNKDYIRIAVRDICDNNYFYECAKSLTK